MRVNQGEEFVIGGYTFGGPGNFDALIFGYYDRENLIYVGRTRNGFTPSSPCASLQGIPYAAYRSMSLLEPSRTEKRPMGSRFDRRKNERLQVAKARTRWAI